MKIQVEKWIFDGERSYKIVQAEKCCDRILNSQVVVLNDEYENGDDTDYSVKLENYSIEWDYDGEQEIYTYEPIKYCPFCGEKIEIEIVNTIDKTEEYLELNNKREELWNKAIRTDSMKKSKKLREEVYVLDKIVNELYYSDGLNRVKVLTLNQEINHLKQYSDELSRIQKEQQLELMTIAKNLDK